MQTLGVNSFLQNQYLINLLFGFSGSFFIIVMASHLRFEKDHFQFSLLVFILFLLLSTIRITHLFSPRYVFQAVPFLILAFNSYYRISFFRVVVSIIGIALGVVSLLGYYSDN
jgi:hypothetical protein